MLSAHRQPDAVAQYAKKARERGLRVLIAGAGLAAALPGVVAAHTTLPVIGVPLRSSMSVGDGMDALLSIVQMPPGVPVACVGVDNAHNAAALAARILEPDATVRRATPEDARTIADIQIETWRATYVGVMPQKVLDGLDVDDEHATWDHWLTVETTAQFVAERSGAAVGFVSVGPCRHEPESGEVYAIYVRPEAWGTGSGWALMDAAVGLAGRALAGGNPLGRGGEPAGAPLLRALRVGRRVDARGGDRPRCPRPRGALPALRPRPARLTP